MKRTKTDGIAVDLEEAGALESLLEPAGIDDLRQLRESVKENIANTEQQREALESLNAEERFALTSRTLFGETRADLLRALEVRANDPRLAGEVADGARRRLQSNNAQESELRQFLEDLEFPSRRKR